MKFNLQAALNTALCVGAAFFLSVSPAPAQTNAKPELFVQTGHTFSIGRLLISPDSRLLVSTSHDATLKIWDLPTREQLRTLRGHQHPVLAAAFHPSGARLASGDLGGDVIIWEIKTGKILRRIDRPRTAFRDMANFPGIKKMAFSPDGKILATAGNEERENVRLWNVETGEAVLTLTFPDFGERDHEILALAFRPDSKVIVTAGSDFKIRFWDVATGRQITEAVHKTETEARAAAERGEDLGIKSFAVTPDGKGLLAKSFPAAFTSDGKFYLEVNNGKLSVADVATKKRVLFFESQEIPNNFNSVAFAPDGKTMVAPVAGSFSDLNVWRLDAPLAARNPAPSFTFKGTPEMTAAAAKPDGRTLALGNTDGWIHLWDVLSDQPPQPLPSFVATDATLDVTAVQPRSVVSQIAFGSQTGKTLLVKTAGTTALYDTTMIGQNGKPLVSPEEFDRLGDPNSFLMSPRRDIFAVLFNSRTTIQLRDAATGAELRTLAGHQINGDRAGVPNYQSNGERSNVSTMVFSPDGKTLATMTSYIVTVKENDERIVQEIKFWNTATGKEISVAAANSQFSLNGEFVTPTFSLENGMFSPDGKIYATKTPDFLLTAADKSTRGIKFWSVATGKEIAVPQKVPAWVDFDRFASLGDRGEAQAVIAADSVILREAAGKKELARLFTVGANDWLVVTPDGLFDGSPAAFSKLKWRFGGDTFDIAPVEAFFNEFFYPGLLKDLMEGKRPLAPANLANLDRRQPKIQINAPAQTAERTVKIAVEIEAAAPNGTIRDARLFRNGSLVKLWRGANVDELLKNGCEAAANSARKIVCQTDLTVMAGENQLTAYAFNGDNVKSRDAEAIVTGADSLKRDGTLYVLAVGINEYRDKELNLRFAVADADSIAQKVAESQKLLGQFAKTEIVRLIDAQATKANILTGLAALQNLQPEDALVIYFAGHGIARCVAAKQGGQNCDRFYLVTHDGTGESASKTDKRDKLREIYQNSLSDEEIERALEFINAGKFLMLIDACNSGQALEAEERRRGPMNSRGLAQLAYEKGMFILAAAQSRQAALETSRLGHGLLTFSLLEGLNKGDADKNKLIAEREWLNFAAAEVPRLQLAAMQAREAENKKLPAAERKRQLVLSEEDAQNTALPPERRRLQTPRVFFRRELETKPLIVARP